MESGHVFSVSVSTVFAAFGLRPRRTGARLARALSRRSAPVSQSVRLSVMIADRPGLCGVHIVCAAIRSAAVRNKVIVHLFAREFWCAGWAVRAPLDGRLVCAAFARGVATRASAGAAARARIPVKDF